MKTSAKIFLLTLLSIAFFVTPALSLDYETAYMVRDNNSHVLSLNSANQYSYFPGEKPWVYIKFEYEKLSIISPFKLQATWSSLVNPTVKKSKTIKLDISGLTDDLEIWAAPPEYWWKHHIVEGKWNVDICWFNGKHGTKGFTSEQFTSCSRGGFPHLQDSCGPVVTPEPLSTTLFLLGGIPVIAAIRRRRKIQ